MTISDAVFTHLRDNVITALVSAEVSGCDLDTLMSRSRVDTDRRIREMFFTQAGPIKILLVTEDPYPLRGPTIKIEDIIITDRDQGIGTLIMSSLVRTCQDAELDLTLEAIPLSGTHTSDGQSEMLKLRRFYERLGFVNAHEVWDGHYIRSPSLLSA